MKLYAYNQDVPLGQEHLGTMGRTLSEKYKTLNGFIRHLKSRGWKTYRVYSYTNFYNDDTFKLLHIKK